MWPTQARILERDMMHDVKFIATRTQGLGEI